MRQDKKIPNRPKYKSKTTKSMKVWMYIRRNRTFRVGDVMMVCDVDMKFLKPFLWHLRGAKYLELQKSGERVEDDYYKFINDTGAKSPSINNGVITDRNTLEKIEINRDEIIPSVLEAMLNVMSDEFMTKSKIIMLSKVAPTSAKLWWSRLVEFGVMRKTTPVRREDSEILFGINKEKVKEAKESLWKKKR